jgi:hypothetical protein
VISGDRGGQVIFHRGQSISQGNVYSKGTYFVETTLRTRIAAVLEEVDAAMLQRIWMELEYRLNVLRATKGAHVEVLP